MIKRTYDEIVDMLSAECTEGNHSEVVIYGVSTDSRTLCKGNLFIPLVGEHYDGHDYVHVLSEHEASASLWQKDHGEPPEGVPIILVENTLTALQHLAKIYREQLNVRVIGITGSNGKTTTKDLTAAILSTTYATAKTAGNLNNHIGLPQTLLKLDDSIEMVVLEMGMSGRGEIELLSQIAKPDAVMITNIGESHIGQLGSREEIAKAKLEICTGLKRNGLIVYNGDEPLLQSLTTGKHNNHQYVSFGFSTNNDYYPTEIIADANGCSFTTNLNDETSYYIPLLGKHNVVNSLAAIAVSKYMGVSDTNIAKGLKNVQASGMRIEVIKGANGITILNDAYNSSPTSLQAALQLLEELKGYRRKIVVIGDMLELGDQEQEYHRNIGKLLHPELVDYVFTYGDLAAYAALEAMPKYAVNQVKSIQDKQSIAKEILSITNAQDLVLIKGSRGMKLEEIVHSLVNETSDEEMGRVN